MSKRRTKDESLIALREPLMKLEACLERLLHGSGALSVLLADMSGHLINEKGSNEELDTVSLAALAAANMAATREMARQIGETASFSDLLYRGQRRHIYVSAVGQTLLLIIIFDETTRFGEVRIFSELAVGELLQMSPHLEVGLEKASAVMDRSLADGLTDELDKAFI